MGGTLPKRTPISARIDAIFRNYYQGQARAKTDELIAGAITYLRAFDLDDNFEGYVDDLLVSKLVNSYILDVIRYKEYHFNYKDEFSSYGVWEAWVHKEKSLNNSKKAAFTAKWLVKVMPIHILNGGGRPNYEEGVDIYTVNETFALREAFAIVGVDDECVPDELKKDILYNFKFRNFDEYWFASCLEVIRHYSGNAN